MAITGENANLLGTWRLGLVVCPRAREGALESEIASSRPRKKVDIL
jgi:hypothetical protein